MEIKIKKLKKQAKGITLVSLVVTIIVLLILAGVTLNFTLGEDGIFKKAGDAVDKYKEAQEKEKNMLMDLESSMDNITGEPIPIKTEEQLLKIGTGEKVEVDGVEYSFNTGRKYILQNDIETSKEYEKIAEKVKNREILLVGNGNKIVETREDGTKAYYTEDSNFYIAVNKYGYVLEGLELYYDGIDNAGEGNHDNKSSIWKDLSGKGHDGMLTNFGNNAISGWHNNYLSFDGINDWVNCGELNYPNVTLEATYIDKSGSYKEFFGNWEGGGNGLIVADGLYKSNININDEYYYLETSTNGKINERLTQSMTYNGKEQILYINGEKKDNIEITGNIKSPVSNTVMAIGTNPTGSEIAIGVSDIDVFSVRIYNRGLTNEEIEVNSKADARRFKKNEIIPIYTEQELLSVENGKIYELKNDIEFSGDYESIINKLNNKEIEIKSSEYKIINNGKYYMSNSKYTIAVNKQGYVIDSLELCLDGIDNEGTGKYNPNATVWKDLSGNNRNGILENMDNSWNDYGLYFDGIDDYVPIAEMNYDNVTLESVISRPENAKVGGHIISNIEAGGYMLYIDGNTGKIGFGVYINEKQAYEFSVGAQGVIQPNKSYSISASYDGERMVGIASGNSIYNQKNLIGTIGKTQNNTMIMLGPNPSRNLPTGEYYNGTIYSTRIYSKSLSDEERAVNYANDKERYLL